MSSTRQRRCIACADGPFNRHTSSHPPTTRQLRRPQSTAPSLSGLTLIGSRIRQNVLTLHDDTNERVGFAQVGDCTALAERWSDARDGSTEAASAA